MPPSTNGCWMSKKDPSLTEYLTRTRYFQTTEQSSNYCFFRVSNSTQQCLRIRRCKYCLQCHNHHKTYTTETTVYRTKPFKSVKCNQEKRDAQRQRETERYTRWILRDQRQGAEGPHPRHPPSNDRERGHQTYGGRRCDHYCQ
jgi:hypothetical protein